MLARAIGATPWGIDARPVQVEVDVRNGLPQMQIVGLADAAVRESRERVRAAIKNCGFELPPKAVVINLAPADLRKEGNHLDLPIALALLAALGQLSQEALADRLVCGELGLDGAIRPIHGALAIAELSDALASSEVLLPAQNAPAAAAVASTPAVPVRHLTEAVEHLGGEARRLPATPPTTHSEPAAATDLAEVKGQPTARRALEIAAAGGHNLLMIGPPGSGKTLLARCLPGLLPPLSLEEAITVTKIHSLVEERTRGELIWQRPFRSPHTGISSAALIGGGPGARPGEVSLAHGGVLFLDEVPEFQRGALEAMRQPLEDGVVTVVRARARFTYPARYTLVAACNPCPCGHLGDSRGRECRCSELQVERYRSRISGPLLDRIDLHVEVAGVSLDDLEGPPGEPTAAVASRVAAARGLQRRRLAPEADAPHVSVPVNAAMAPAVMRSHCRLDDAGRRLLRAAFDRLGLSARAHSRILKVSRTLADLDGAEAITAQHVAEAIQYRGLDRGARMG